MYYAALKPVPWIFTLEFAIGNKWATESDSADVGAQVGHGLHYISSRMDVQMRVFNHELCDAGEHSSQTHQAVERGHKLRQVRNLNPLSDRQTWWYFTKYDFY